MGLFAGVAGLVWKSVALVSGFLGSLWSVLGLVWKKLVALVGQVLGVVWGLLVALGLLVAAVVLNVLRVDDVYASLRRVVDRDESTEKDAVERVRQVSPEEITDDAGRFSPELFASATGMTPAEFVHLYVRSRGGRVKQKSLTRCLPWSKSTVSRLLDTLESEDVVERVELGRENLVCTPESVPGRAET